MQGPISHRTMQKEVPIANEVVSDVESDVSEERILVSV